MTEPTALVETYPDVHLCVAGRTIVVPGWQLFAAGPFGFPPYTVCQPAPHLLNLRPTWQTRLVGTALMLVGGTVAFFVCEALWAGGHWAVAFFGLGGLFLATAGIYAIGGGHRFDREGGVMADYWFNTPARTRRLSDVVAVQVVAGWHRQRGGGRSESFELNLVVDSPRRPRLSVSNCTDRAWTLGTAERLATFLGVPLVRQCSPTKER